MALRRFSFEFEGTRDVGITGAGLEPAASVRLENWPNWVRRMGLDDKANKIQ
jgi:hypothetical protein